jgi:hypothetical protein
MPTRPILDPNLPNVSSSGPTAAQPAQASTPDSPLASQLPSWDLLPAHTLLVRRRPAPANKPTAPMDAPVSKPKETSPPPLPAQLRASAAATSEKGSAFCQNCGARLEAGSTFCTGCGTKVG